ncbi:MAG: hypothetical protein OXH63_13175 [Gemmatimonadetes bacterium]|nr:hypothetical protein [Gemmatimonadota bacterium]
MKFQGAVIKEQGITFAVVIVKKYVLDNLNTAKETIQSFAPIFSGLPVVLMAQDHKGNPSYYGRKDIAEFMANVPLSAIPWREYTLT